jgi:hypothetical protein
MRDFIHRYPPVVHAAIVFVMTAVIMVGGHLLLGERPTTFVTLWTSLGLAAWTYVDLRRRRR